MNARHTLILSAIAFAMVTSNPSAASADGASKVEHFPLSKGSYRLAGECKKMTFLEMDITSECLHYVGILTADPDRPEFFFPRKDNGAWIFKTSSSAIVTEGGVSTYKMESVTDVAAKRISRYNGECILTASGTTQGVHCTLWRDEARKTIVREAIFSANGSWIFGK